MKANFVLGAFYAFYFRGKSQQEIKNKGLLNDTTGLQTSTQSQPSLLRICKANFLPNFLCRPASGSTMRSSANVEKQLLNDIASYFLLQIRSSESTSQQKFYVHGHNFSSFLTFLNTICHLSVLTCDDFII